MWQKRNEQLNERAGYFLIFPVALILQKPATDFDFFQ